MRPFMGGGDMIRDVTRDIVTYNDPPMKFEAGTPGIVQQIGLGAALEYMMSVGMESIAAHERDLRDYARARLDGLNWLNVQGNRPARARSFPSRWTGRRMRMTFPPCSTRRAWRCARATTARSR